jgi:hypothetical protein
MHKYLSPLSLASNLHAGHILEVDSIKHILGVLINNNNVLLDGRSLWWEKENEVNT